MKDIIKVSEKFKRNTTKPASQDIQKRIFFVPEERIRIIFHLEEGYLFPSFREYKRPNMEVKSNNVLQVLDNFESNVFAKPLMNRQLQTELFELVQAELALWQDIKKMDREVRDILNLRMEEENQIQLTVSLLDTVRNKEIDPEQEEKDKEQKKEDEEIKAADLDYLSPFLINFVILFIYSDTKTDLVCRRIRITWPRKRLSRSRTAA